MKARIFKTISGFDIINSRGELFSTNGEVVKKIGTIGPKFKPSGRLLKKIPNHIRTVFYSIQNK